MDDLYWCHRYECEQQIMSTFNYLAGHTRKLVIYSIMLSDSLNACEYKSAINKNKYK